MKKLNSPRPGRKGGTRLSPSRLFAAFAAIAILLFVSEHRAHALGYALHALLAICLVLLVLGSSDSRDGERRSSSRNEEGN